MNLRNSSTPWVKDPSISAVTFPWQSCLHVSCGTVGFPFVISLVCDQDPVTV